MTKEQFSVQMGRLTQMHKDKYPPERIKVFWDRFGSVPGDVFSSAITKAIGKFIKPPMADEIDSCIISVREEINRSKKQEHKRDAKEFFAAEMSDEDTRWRMSIIKGRIAGKVSDEDWAEYMQLSKRLADEEKAREDAWK